MFIDYTLDIGVIVGAGVFGYGAFKVLQFQVNTIAERLREHSVTTQKQAEVQAAHSTAIATIAEAIVSIKTNILSLDERIARNESRIERHEQWHAGKLKD